MNPPAADLPRSPACPYATYVPRPVRVEDIPGLAARKPPRPVHLRQRDYGARFDFGTVWHDCFRSFNGKWIVLAGPPLLNLACIFDEGEFHHPRHSRFPAHRRIHSNTEQVWLLCPDELEEVELRTPGRSLMIPVAANQCRTFGGRRVLLTVVKDDRIEWIRDWVRFHARCHGIDAVLIYDNQSSVFTGQELSEAIAGIPEIAVARVVEWFFPYGPDGGGAMPWDSNYGQAGALEHAHHLFLQTADAVLSCDVDELVVDEEGLSVCDLCHQSPTGYLQFPGRWNDCLANGDGPSVGDVRHVDHAWLTTRGDPNCPDKWALVPGRVDSRCQWQAHCVWGAEASVLPGLEFRHCRGISTSWKHDRSWRLAFDPSVHVPDQALIACFLKSGLLKAGDQPTPA